MKTIKALLLTSSLLALSGGIATAQIVGERNTAPGASSGSGVIQNQTTNRGGDPEASQNGERIVGPGDPAARQQSRVSRWRGDRDDNRWRSRGYSNRYNGWRDRDWDEPGYGYGYGAASIWPFPTFFAYDEPTWVEPAPNRRFWNERRGRDNYGQWRRQSVENPSRGAQSGT